MKKLFSGLCVLLLAAMLMVALPAQSVSAATLCVNTGGTDGCYATIDAALAAAVNGDTIEVQPGTYVLAAPVTINKDVTITGIDHPVLQVSGTGERIIMTTAGATLDGFYIEKTDTTGVQNIIYVGANDLTIQNNKIWGQYVIGDPDVSRAMVFTGGLSGLSINHNEIYDLRQPAYISGVSTGVISDNYVYRTRGWVVEQGDMTFTNNTWGVGADANVFDIAVLGTVNPIYYTDIPALAAANNGAAVEDQRVSPAVLSNVYVDGSVAVSGTGTIASPKKTIVEGIARVASGGTVYVAAGTYNEVGQIVIGKNVTIVGADTATTIIKPSGNTGSAGDARGWWLVNAGASLDLSHVTLDGTGFQVFQAIRSNGTGFIHDNLIKNIRYSQYLGMGIVMYDDMTIQNNVLENIERLGIIAFGPSVSAGVIDGNTYTGKGDGDWLDYGIEVGGGAVVTITNNTITNCTGVAVSDGSTSAGILATTYYGPGTSATITGNTISNSTTAIAVGYDGSDTSTVVAEDNTFTGNEYGISSTGPAVDASPNWWGTADGDAIAALMDGSITFEPYYITSAMTTLSEPLPTVVYVDGTYVDGAAGGHIFGYDAFTTIQDGIDGVAVGGTVNVAAGAYTEDPQINKAVTLLGPNAAINPNTGVRGAEAIIYPAVSAPDPNVCEVSTYVSVSNVTIKGFTFNGDNPALTSGILIDGADVDACELIAGYEGVGGIVIENNILKNATYSGIDFYNYTSSAATSGNYIRYNRIEDIGTATYGYGLGILIYNNFYADITDNVLDNVRVGIQTGNFEKANPGTTGSISRNVINAWRLGIFNNLWYSNASTITLSENTITAIPTAGLTKWVGMLWSSFQTAVSATVEDNVIIIPDTISVTAPGYAAGYDVWNTPTTAPLTISGGSVTGGTYGVFINNYNGYNSNANNTHMIVDGVTITGADTAGVYVYDNPANTTPATVTATVQNCVITDSGAAVLVEGTDANGSAMYNQFIDNDNAGFENLTGNLMVATPNWWGSALGPGPVGPGDGDGVSINVGFSPWCANPECTLFGTLVDAGSDVQDLLDAANPGDIITLGPGVFAGGFSITTPGITILGTEGTIIEGGLPGIAIHADDVTLKDFTMACGVDATGIYLQHDSLPLNNVTLEGLEVTQCKTGIEVATPVTNIKLLNNWIHANTGDGLLFQKPASVTGDTTVIKGNLFKVNGGYGIQNLNSRTVDARYNSWGATTAAGGDKVKGKVNVANPTYAEVFLDVKPYTNATEVKVARNSTFPVGVRIDARGLYGAEAKVTYQPELLTYVGFSAGNFKGTGTCVVTDSIPAGELTIVCRRSNPNLDASGVLTMALLNFTANGPAITTDADLFESTLDVSDVKAADRNGFEVFVNNGGYDAPSAWGIRTITDGDDGLVQITSNLSFTGFIALQGRLDNSGAVMSIYASKLPASLIAAGDALSIGDGSFWAMAPELLLGRTYYLKADAPLYLPTTPVTSTSILDYKKLSANVINLKKVVLLGGDASNNDKVDLTDATCIAAGYNGIPGACGADINSSTDVNGDGVVNLLDLVMVGSSFNKTSSPWTP